MNPRSHPLRLIGATLVALALSIAGHCVAQAQDRELTQAADFRVRVQAAQRLGRTGPSARADLERGLRDAHPAVRVACVVGLGNIGDVASVPALSRAMKNETVASVKTTTQETIDKIRTKNASVDRAKYVIQLGSMRNTTGIRSDDLDSVMKEAVRVKGNAIRGAVVVEANDSALIKRASKKRIPVLLVDASLTSLTQATAKDGAVTVSAHVDLAVRKIPQQILRGTVSGNASASDNSRIGRDALTELQNRVVGGAVESAMSSVGSSIHTLTN